MLKQQKSPQYVNRVPDSDQGMELPAVYQNRGGPAGPYYGPSFSGSGGGAGGQSRKAVPLPQQSTHTFKLNMSVQDIMRLVAPRAGSEDWYHPAPNRAGPAGLPKNPKAQGRLGTGGTGQGPPPLITPQSRSAKAGTSAISPRRDISPPPQYPAYYQTTINPIPTNGPPADGAPAAPAYYPGAVKAALAAVASRQGGPSPAGERSNPRAGPQPLLKDGKRTEEALLAREIGYDVRVAHNAPAGVRVALPSTSGAPTNSVFGGSAVPSTSAAPPFALTGKKKTQLATQIYTGSSSRSLGPLPSRQGSYGYSSGKVSAVAAAAVALLPRAREGPAPWHMLGDVGSVALKANRSSAWGKAGDDSTPLVGSPPTAFGRSTVFADGTGREDPKSQSPTGLAAPRSGTGPGAASAQPLGSSLKSVKGRSGEKASPHRARPPAGPHPEAVAYVHNPEMQVVGHRSHTPVGASTAPAPAASSPQHSHLHLEGGKGVSHQLGVSLRPDRAPDLQLVPARELEDLDQSVEDDTMQWEPPAVSNHAHAPGPSHARILQEQSSVFEEPMPQPSYRWSQAGTTTAAGRGVDAERSATALRYREEELEVEEDVLVAGGKPRPMQISEGVSLSTPDGMWSAANSAQGRGDASKDGLLFSNASDSFMRSSEEGGRGLVGSGDDATYYDDEDESRESRDTPVNTRHWSEGGTIPAVGEVREDSFDEEEPEGGELDENAAKVVATVAPLLDEKSNEELARLHSKYEVLSVVGEGAYGLVMRCGEKVTRRQVAIKEFKINDKDADAEDVRRTARREVKLLRELQHPNVVRYIEDFTIGGRTFIVMEFVPRSVLELLENSPSGPGLPKPQVKSLLYQLIQAITFLHSKSVLYRDIKPENLLVEDDGTLKLCDFGFARYVSSPEDVLTDYVATRWYRAPELLLGPPYWTNGRQVRLPYSQPVDLWAVGCLMGELADGQPLFPGDSDLDQLYRIVQMMGPLPNEQMEAFRANPNNEGIEIPSDEPITLQKRYKGVLDPLELDLMAKLLEMDPAKRISGAECLKHPYFAQISKEPIVPAPEKSRSKMMSSSVHSA